MAESLSEYTIRKADERRAARAALLANPAPKSELEAAPVLKLEAEEAPKELPQAPPEKPEAKPESNPFDSGEAGLGSTTPASAKPATGRMRAPVDLDIAGTERNDAFGDDPLGKSHSYGVATAKDVERVFQGKHNETEMALAAGAMIYGDEEIPTKREIIEELGADVWESAPAALLPLDTSRRALWNLVYDLGALLPEDGNPEGTSEGSMEELAGTAMQVVMEGYLNTTRLRSLALGPALENGNPYKVSAGEFWEGDGLSDSDKESFNKMGRGLYDAFASGKLEERAGLVQEPMLWGESKDDFFGDTHGDYPRGEHVVDAMITPEEAFNLAKTTNNPTVKWWAEVLSSDSGRLMTGLGLEIGVDPLWLVGPAKGAGTIAHAKKIYTISRPLMEGAAALERVAPVIKGVDVGTEFRRTMLLTVEGVGTAEKTEEARKVVTTGVQALELMSATDKAGATVAREAIEAGGDMALFQARTVRKAEIAIEVEKATAARLAGRDAVSGVHSRKAASLTVEMEKINSVKATSILAREVKRLEASSKSWAKASEDLRKGLRFAKRSTATAATEKGIVAWSIPFGKKTRYVIPAKAAAGTTGGVRGIVKAVVDTLPPGITSIPGHAEDLIKPFSSSAFREEVKALKASGMSEDAALLLIPRSKKFAHWVQEATGKGVALPLIAWTILSEALGSRFLQPMYARMESAASHGDMGLAFSKLPVVGRWRPVKAAPPQVWETYHNALTSVFNEGEKLESLLFASVKRIQAHTDTAYKFRKRASSKGEAWASEKLGRKVSPEELAEWGDPGYYPEHVLAEAGSHREAGSGFLRDRPDLVPAVMEMERFIDELSGTLKVERLELANASANIGRFAEGDILKRDQFLSEIDKLRKSVDMDSIRVEGQVAVSEAAATKRIGEIKSAQEWLEGVTIQELSRGVLGIQSVNSKGEPGISVMYNTLLQSLDGNEEIANRIVMAAVAYAGDMKTVEALMHFAFSGESARLLHGMKGAKRMEALAVRQAAVGGLSGNLTPAETVTKGLEDTIRVMDTEASVLEDVFKYGPGDSRVVINGQAVFSGMNVEQFGILMDTLAKRSITRARMKAGPGDWHEFIRWYEFKLDHFGGSRLDPTKISIPPMAISPEQAKLWGEAAKLMERAEVLANLKMEAAVGRAPLNPRVNLADLAKGEWGPRAEVVEEIATTGPRPVRKLKAAVEVESKASEPVWTVAEEYVELFTEKQKALMDIFMREQRKELSLTELAAELGVTEGMVNKQLNNLKAKTAKGDIAPPMSLMIDGKTVELTKDAYKVGKTDRVTKTVTGVKNPMQRAVLEALEAGDTTLPELVKRLGGLPKRDWHKVNEALGRLNGKGFIARSNKGTPPKWGLLAESDELFEASKIVQAVKKAEKAAGSGKQAKQLGLDIPSAKSSREAAADSAASAMEATAPERLTAGVLAEQTRVDIEALKGLTPLGGGDSALLERLRRVVGEAKTPDEAQKMILDALSPLFKGDGVGQKSMLENYSYVLGRDLFKANNLTEAQKAMRDGVDILEAMSKRMAARVGAQNERTTKLLREQHAVLKAAMPEEIRRLGEAADLVPLRIPEGLTKASMETGDGYRKVQQWEEKIWRKWAEITKDMTPRDKTIVSFAGLRKENELLTPHEVEILTAAGYSPMGKRLGAMPAELEKTVNELRLLVDRYEDLYEEIGFVFTKDPTAMMKQWGVFGYVPHLQQAESAKGMAGVLQSVKQQRELMATQRGHKSATTASLDSRFSLDMDAKQARSIQGTIREINAMRDESALTLGLDPMSILGRYMQANKAITNKQMIAMFVEGGVFTKVGTRVAEDGRIMNPPEVAALEDMVPLLTSRWKDIEKDILFGGGRAEWEERFVKGLGLSPENVGAWLADAAEEGSSIFATWQKDIPSMGTIKVVEDFYISLRSRQFAKGDDLVDVPALIESGMPYEKIAEMLNAEARAMGMTDRKVNDKMLKAFFGAEDKGALWELYVPRAVLENMEMMFKPTYLDEGIPGMARDTAQAVNTFFKTRMTVISIAFSVRNATSNTMTNILDLGVGGALNPMTNLDASVLAQAAHWAEEYGSIEKAADILSRGLDPLELAALHPAKALVAKGRHAASRAAWEANPIRLYVERGIDFGDGANRTLDEALAVLREKGVISQAFTQMSDISVAERSILSGMLNKNGLTDKLVRAASAAEDIFIVAFPAALTASSGGMPLVVGLPKKLGGEYVARYVENQSRITNFIGNVKRGGSYTSASENVQKHLFNYGDLTSFQKSWMRLFVPFFTWNQKNLELQFKVLRDSPYAHATYSRLFLEAGPEVLKAKQSENMEVPYIPIDKKKMARDGEIHNLMKVHLPFTQAEDTYVVGLGFPQTGALEKISMVMGMLAGRQFSDIRVHDDRNRNTRILAEVHVALKVAVELGMMHHSYYDKPISEMKNATGLAQSIMVLGLISPELRDAVADYVGLMVTADSNGVPIAHAMPNYLFGSVNPYARVLNDAAARVDQYAVDHSIDPRFASTENMKKIPSYTRTIDALSGLNVKQRDDIKSETRSGMRVDKVADKVLISRGVALETKGNRIAVE